MTEHKPYGPYERFIKRLFDFVCSLLAIILLSPLLLITALLVRIKMGSPILFCQERPGRNEKTFKLYKFRSMRDMTDKNGRPLSDEERLTSFGRKLRATSIDELPELFNVLKGDMSFVGPRPLLNDYLPYYTEQEHHRHDVRPGITGLAQVNGRNNVEWTERFALDVEYVRKITFSGDMKILFKTVAKVVCASDIAENTRESEGNFAEIRRKQAASSDSV